MALKAIARQLCPPVVWTLATAVNRRLGGRKSPQTVTRWGPRTELRGVVEIREEGGAIFVGSDCLVEGRLVAETNKSRIVVGDNVFIGGGTLIDCALSVQICDDVLVSYECIIADSDNHSTSYSVRRHDLSGWKAGSYDWSRAPIHPVTIKKGAWLGARVIVLKGVTIGEGAVVGAGSVVTRNVAPYTIVAGNPARLVREIPPDER